MTIPTIEPGVYTTSMRSYHRNVNTGETYLPMSYKDHWRRDADHIQSVLSLFSAGKTWQHAQMIGENVARFIFPNPQAPHDELVTIYRWECIETV